MPKKAAVGHKNPAAAALATQKQYLAAYQATHKAACKSPQEVIPKKGQGLLSVRKLVKVFLLLVHKKLAIWEWFQTKEKKYNGF